MKWTNSKSKDKRRVTKTTTTYSLDNSCLGGHEKPLKGTVIGGVRQEEMPGEKAFMGTSAIIGRQKQ